MSALCAAASSRMRPLTVCGWATASDDLVAVVVLQPHAEVRRASGSRTCSRRWRSRALLGTQSVSTAAPPSPSLLDDGDLRAEPGGDQRRLVASGASADDDNRRLARDHGVDPTIPGCGADRAPRLPGNVPARGRPR